MAYRQREMLIPFGDPDIASGCAAQQARSPRREHVGYPAEATFSDAAIASDA